MRWERLFDDLEARFEADERLTHEADVADLVGGALQQQRLLATAPRRPTDDDLASVFRGSMEHW